MNDQSILVKLFLLTLFIGNISMNLVGEGSGVVKEGSGVVGEGSEVFKKIPAYGWLGPGDPVTFLKETEPELRKFEEVPLIQPKDYQPKYTQTQNMARWALGRATVPRMVVLNSFHTRDELLNAMIWLMGQAEGKLGDWKVGAANWKQHKGPLPEDRSRMASFNPNAVIHYGWLTEARESKLVDLSASDDTAIAAYLGWLLSKKKRTPPAEVHYPK